jgi:hypothetical protein
MIYSTMSNLFTCFSQRKSPGFIPSLRKKIKFSTIEGKDIHKIAQTLIPRSSFASNPIP